MKKSLLLLSSLSLIVLVVYISLGAFVGEGTTVLNEGEGVEPEVITDIKLFDVSWNPITMIPKGQAFWIMAYFSPAVNYPKATYIMAGVDDEENKTTYMAIVENNTASASGLGCCTAIPKSASSGQTVPIIVKLDGNGSKFKVFTVQ